MKGSKQLFLAHKFAAFFFIFLSYCYSAKAFEPVVNITTVKMKTIIRNAHSTLWFAYPQHINNIVDFSFLMTMFIASYLLFGTVALLTVPSLLFSTTVTSH